jgi:hypothetical protein
MPLLLVALFLFTAVQAAAESFPIGEQSDITSIPSPTDLQRQDDITNIPSPADLLRQDDEQVSGPFDRESEDVFESLLQELNERGVLEQVAPLVLVPSKRE